MNQASYPFRILVSPMRRTLLTIKPTLERLQRLRSASGVPTNFVRVVVVGYYFETEGCHLRGEPEEGMTPRQIRELLKDCLASDTAESHNELQFVGFPEGDDRGWYADGTGPETRAEAEVRAAKYCLWLSEYLDQQLLGVLCDDGRGNDVFDASISIEGDNDEAEHDKHATRGRRRRTYLAIGHGDFMSTVLKRMVTGFGHYVESDGIPHRCAFAHFNTGITELEYFGHGRYLIMSTNQTPHIQASQYKALRTGGTLKDGWSFLIPTDEAILSDAEVAIVFDDTELEDHIREQSVALKALYLSSSAAESLKPPTGDLEVEEEQPQLQGKGQAVSHIIVKRGLQVLGVATYSDETGQLSDVAIRPTANKDDKVAETLMQAVKKHARKLGRSASLIVHPRSADAMQLFEKMGFTELDDPEEGNDDVEEKKQVMTTFL
jgi:hypothetical protein